MPSRHHNVVSCRPDDVEAGLSKALIDYIVEPFAASSPRGEIHHASMQRSYGERTDRIRRGLKRVRSDKQSEAILGYF